MEQTPLLGRKEREEGGRGDLKNLILVNVVIVLVSLGTQIAAIVLPQYIYKRVGEELYSNATRHQMKSESICFTNKSDPNFYVQEKVQETTTVRLTQLTLANGLPVIVTILILGAYVDYVGRKRIFIAAIFGHFVRDACLAVVIFWNLSTDFLYIGYGIDAICGGFCSLLLLGYVYTADHTVSIKARTFAMGVMTTSNIIASTVGNVLTGYGIEKLGFFYPMLISATVTLLALVLAMVCVAETLQRRNNKWITPLQGLSNVFGFYYSKTYDGKRLIFWLAMLGFLFTVISAVGGMSIMTLFLFNFPFCWDAIKLGWYNTASISVVSVFGLLALKMMQQCMSEGTIALIGSLSFAAHDIYIGLCTTDIMVYMSPIAEILCLGTLPVIRSLISQMVTQDRQGSIFASLAFVEAICYAGGSSFFNLVYKATVGGFKGAVFQIMGGMHIIAFVVYILLINRRKKYNLRQQMLERLPAQEED